MGPLPFIVFVNTIVYGVASSVLKFADDITVFGVINDASHQDAFQSDLDKLMQWSERWQMELNFTECNTLHIGSIKNGSEHEMNDHKLEEIAQKKDQGVVIDNKLPGSNQVLEARKKALRMLGLLI